MMELIGKKCLNTDLQKLVYYAFRYFIIKNVNLFKGNVILDNCIIFQIGPFSSLANICGHEEQLRNAIMIALKK